MKNISEEEYQHLKLFKKLYDNSFYPQTYNIEKNCVEYPDFPGSHGPTIFYFPNEECKQKALKAAKKKLEITIKKKNKIKTFLVDLDDIVDIKD